MYRSKSIRAWSFLIPQAPADRRPDQASLFEKALEAFAAMNDDLVNKVMEVLDDGSVHIRDWNADAHNIGQAIRNGADKGQRSRLLSRSRGCL
jgi:hypothetical protein